MSYEQAYAELYGEATEEVLLADKARHKKRHARAAVKYALKSGRLVKPEHCEYADCQDPDPHAHHPDYNYPLEVLWLCRYHHNELHRHLGDKILVF